MWTPESCVLVGDFGAGQSLSDAQYRLIEPLIPAAKPGGRPRTTDMRRMLDALFGLAPREWRGGIRTSRSCVHADPLHVGTRFGRGAIAQG